MEVRVLPVLMLFCYLSSCEDLWKNLANHPAWSILSKYECGESAADRIIGGKNAAMGQFPWIARLGYLYPEDKEVEWMCGGALITDTLVITAAHCVQPADFELKIIRLGEHDMRTNPDCELRVCAPAVQDRQVKSILSHPHFNDPLFHNDIAIIEMSQPAALNNYVSPICLPGKEQIGTVPVGELVTVAGWGKMNMTTEDVADILQVVSIPVVNSSLCDTLGSKFKLNESEICAGAEKNKDACGGDSGGPLMKVFDTPEGPKNYLVGLVSFGSTICGIKKPAVYTAVSHFMPWILNSITSS